MTNQDEWYAKMNPKMSIPTLKYNDHILTINYKIINFLIEKHPDKELMPSHAVNRVKVEKYVNDMFSKFGDIKVFTYGHMAKNRLFT